MFRWYVVNTYSGHENKVKANLEHRIESMGQRQRFRRVVVPTEQVIETKDGQKVQAEKRVLPGYVLVNMDLNDDAWTVVKNTPGVTGFVGAGSKPVPLSQPEVDRILKTGQAADDDRVLARRVRQGDVGPALGLRRRDRRRQPGPAEAQGAGRHLRAPGPGRARVRPGEEARLGRAHGEEGPHRHQAADPGRAGEPGAAGRPCARPARRQHHGVLQGVQRADGAGERPHHSCRDHRLRGPQLRVRHEDAAGGRLDQGGAAARKGLGRAEPVEGRKALARPAPLDRRDEDAGPERARRRTGDARDRRHGPIDGRGGGSVVAGHGKRYRDARGGVDREHLYSPVEAIRLLKDSPGAKFDETVEVHLNLGLNVRHADEQLRGTMMLPHGTGREQRVAVFAEGEKAREAEEAGADVVGSADLAKRIEEGFTDFDVAIATPDQMGNVGRLGRVLGPRGLMPNPKTGTVTFDVGKAVRDAKAGKLEYRTDRGANVHVPIGKKSFDERALVENYAALIDEIVRAKPSAAKGRYIKKITLSSTMGPGIHVDPTRTRDIAEDLEAAPASA